MAETLTPDDGQLNKPEVAAGDAGVDSKADEIVIPEQYNGMPSEMVEEMWAAPVSVEDPQGQQQAEQRTKAIEMIRLEEQAREQAKTARHEIRYQHLTPDQQRNFVATQQEASQIVAQAVKDERQIDGLLSVEELWVLNKAKEAFEKAREQNPNAPVTLQFSQPIDRTIYSNMVNKLAFSLIADRSDIAEQSQTNDIRREIGIEEQPVKAPESSLIADNIESEKPVDTPLTPESSPEHLGVDLIKGNEEAKKLVLQTLDKLAASGTFLQKTVDMIKRNLESTNDTSRIASTLVDCLYQNMRMAKYPSNEKSESDYADACKYATEDGTLPHKIENGWVYRGIMKSKSKGLETVTRGSMNVNLSADLLRDLDALISSGQIKANYKLPDPDSSNEPGKRHDSVTIYFLEEPSAQALSSLGTTAGKYLRGNDLIGDKVAEGFYMSEIGSVSDEQAIKFVNDLKAINADLGIAIDSKLTSPNKETGIVRTAMSEAQYFAIQRTLECYGLKTDYNKADGISISRL